jgi:regulator of protease activity HflC (stomatin/prohibitin superfamily)
MLWLIFTILLSIVGAIGLIWAFAAPAGEKFGGIVTVVVSTLVFIALTFALSLHTVGQRQVGLVQSFSGTIGSHYKSPGIVMTAPWNHIKTENVGLQKEIFVFDDSNSAVSKDQQPITATLAVNYQVEPANVVRLYKTVGPNWKTVLLDGRIPQAFKETTAKFSSPDITLQRTQLREQTLRRLRAELAPYDVRVVDVFVSNVGYSKAYTDAIEQKLVQRQAALTAQAKVDQAKFEADQKIKTAEGDAKAIELKGRALRNNPEILRLEAIDKLNPHATIVFCSSGDCPSFLPSSVVTTGGR